VGDEWDARLGGCEGAGSGDLVADATVSAAQPQRWSTADDVGPALPPAEEKQASPDADHLRDKAVRAAMSVGLSKDAFADEERALAAADNEAPAPRDVFSCLAKKAVVDADQRNDCGRLQLLYWQLAK